MGLDWQIGDPVDDANGGTMDAQNWGHGSDDDETANTTIAGDSDDYSKRAWDCYMDFKESEALRYINKALELDDRNPKSWNKKAIILEAMKRYPESEECYNKSLELSRSDVVFDNKARMLYDWAFELLEESKEMQNGGHRLKKADEIIKRSIRALSGDSDEDIEKYLQLRDSIRFYIEHENEFERNLETLKGYDRDELFTIAGRKFYNNGITLLPGMELELVREPDNEHDRDAIAVYAKGEKVGYVANSPNTKYELTSSASELKDKVHDSAKAKYLLYLSRYANIQFDIARIIL